MLKGNKKGVMDDMFDLLFTVIAGFFVFFFLIVVLNNAVDSNQAVALLKVEEIKASENHLVFLQQSSVQEVITSLAQDQNELRDLVVPFFDEIYTDGWSFIVYESFDSAIPGNAFYYGDSCTGNVLYSFAPVMQQNKEVYTTQLCVGVSGRLAEGVNG